MGMGNLFSDNEYTAAQQGKKQWRERLNRKAVDEVPEAGTKPTVAGFTHNDNEYRPSPAGLDLLERLARSCGIVDKSEHLIFEHFTSDGLFPSGPQIEFIEKVERKLKVELAEVYEQEAAQAAAEAAQFDGVDGEDDADELDGEYAAPVEVIPVDEATILAEAEKLVQPVSLDMSFYVECAPDNMEAWGLIVPAYSTGCDMDAEEAFSVLATHGIVFGIHEEEIRGAFASSSWLRLITVASGRPPVDGIDGSINEHFEREKKISFSEDAMDAVDYKNLNQMQKITAGEIICDILPPTPHEDGTNIYGHTVPAYVPKPTRVPSGKNTVLNDEKTALCARIDGQLKFANDMFYVEQATSIKENLDSSVGNLDVFGDVHIGGSVYEGFTVKATGNVTVLGVVEGAHIISGGNITISLGVKGNAKGVLEAKGNIKCLYLENCTVRAFGSVTADSIINSDVVSGDSVVTMTGRGVIIGGKTAALNYVKAKAIGNESNRSTNLVLGENLLESESISQLKADLTVLTSSIEEIEKNLKYLATVNKPSAEYLKIISQLKFKLSVEKMALVKKTKLLETKEAEYGKNRSDICQIQANAIYPSTVVTIGSDKATVQLVQKNCRIYKKEGEIVFGTM